jgi:hypothetical protein
MKIILYKYTPKEEITKSTILRDSDIIERRILPKFCSRKLIKHLQDDTYGHWNNSFFYNPRPFINLNEYYRIWYKNQYVYNYHIYKELDIGENEILDENTVPRKIEDELLGKDICQEEDVYLLTKYINPDIKEQFMKEVYPYFVEGETFIWLDIWN